MVQRLHSRPFSRLYFIISTGLLFLVALLFSTPAHSLTVTGDITADALWDVADSPVFVTDTDFRIAVGTRLTIAPGVAVYFAGSLTVFGTFESAGTAVNPVLLAPLDAINGWGGITFTRNDCTETHNLSFIDETVVDGLVGGIVIDRQSLTVSNSDILMSGSNAIAVKAYNNNTGSCAGPFAGVDFNGNTMTVDSTYSGSIVGGVFLINGIDAYLTGNTITATFAGPADFYGVKYLTQDSYNLVKTVMDLNTFTLTTTNPLSDIMHGINMANMADNRLDAAITANTFTMNGKHELIGLELADQSAWGNSFTLTSNTIPGDVAEERDLIGIYSLSGNDATRLEYNRVTLQSDQDRSLIGILCQDGSIVNNRIVGRLNGSAGYAIGIIQQYYEAAIENNSVALTAAGSQDIFGMYFSAKIQSSVMSLKNNIIAATGGLQTVGIFKGSIYSGIIAHAYNLIHGFNTPYSGVSAGEGDVSADPLFSNANLLTLDPFSPAIDRGDWNSAYDLEPKPNGGRVDIGAFGNHPSALTTVEIVSPEITTNSGFDFATADLMLTLDGRTSSSTYRVIVNGAETGVSYTIGDTRWSYTGTLAAGPNTMEVTAVRADNVASFPDYITVTTPDNVPPQVVNATPVTPAPIDAPIVVTFSEDMDGATLTPLTFFVNGVSGSVSYATKVATFTPDSALSYDTIYTATVSGAITDLIGNAIGSNFTWSFTTAPQPDMIPPTVVSVSPANGATRVSTLTNIEATFSEPLDASTVSGTTFLINNGVTGTVTLSGTKVSFKTASPLARGTAYTATLTSGIKDLAGNALSSYSWFFTTTQANTPATPDVIAPMVSWVLPANNAANVGTLPDIQVGFSEFIDPATMNGATFSLNKGAAGTVSLSGSVATFKLSAPLVGNTTYTATLTTGIKDLAGNALKNNYSWSFTTAIPDTTPPTVNSVRPTDGKTGVGLTPIIKSVFSEKLNAATVNGVTFTVNNGAVGSVSLIGTTAYFNLSAPLAKSTWYTVTLTSGIEDLAGNALATYMWTFRTKN